MYLKQNTKSFQTTRKATEKPNNRKNKQIFILEKEEHETCRLDVYTVYSAQCTQCTAFDEWPIDH